MSEPVPPTPPNPEPMPTARVVPRSFRLGWFWLLPGATVLMLALVLGLSWARSGVAITLRFRDGHGLKPGDTLRCRGIVIGEVSAVRLDPGGEGVIVQALLHAEAAEVARAGSRFWIARPQADFVEGVRGLDTIVGARYVIVQPGSGALRSDFVGLETAPVPEMVAAGGLQLVLQADRLGGLRPGAPVTFRQVRIGSVLRVELASDASAVDVHIYIRPAYARLVRQGSKFWNTSGVRVSATLLSGLILEAESAEALLVGGIALATPPEAGPPVQSGARLRLEAKADPKWEQWRPPAEIAAVTPPAGAAVPRPVPATLLYQTRGYLWGTRTYTRRGLVVPIGQDLFGPADLLRAPREAVGKGTLTLQTQPPATAEVDPGTTTPAVAWLAGAAAPPGPMLAVRVPAGPEDCLLIGEVARDPWPLSAARLRKEGAGWEIDASVPGGGTWASWHGAVAQAVKDGRILGLLWAPEGAKKGIVLPVDETTVSPSR